MSAFMVSSETIASLAKVIMTPHCKYSMMEVRPDSRECYKFFQVDWGVPVSPTQFRSWEELADAMTLMNVEALRQRYGEIDPDYFMESVESVDLNAVPKKLRPVQFFKSLQCFMYQCTEGNVPDSAQYKALNAYEKDVPRRIIMNMPAYEKARW